MRWLTTCFAPGNSVALCLAFGKVSKVLRAHVVWDGWLPALSKMDGRTKEERDTDSYDATAIRYLAIVRCSRQSVRVCVCACVRVCVCVSLILSHVLSQGRLCLVNFTFVLRYSFFRRSFRLCLGLQCIR